MMTLPYLPTGLTNASLQRSLQCVVVFSLIAITAPEVRSQGGPPATDAVFVRAQQMVTAGQASAGRAVVDSVLAATPEGTPRYAEALFWHASLNETAAGAERDYRRIAVEYPLSPRAQEALYRLAQLELTRGDRAAARSHLERIQREHPSGATSARASVKLAQLAFDDGDAAAACAAIAAARDGLTASDVELRNQVEYYAPRCANLAVTAVRDSVAAAMAVGSRSTASATTRQEYSVQVAAYQTREAAQFMAKRLTMLGYAVRVVGDRNPYRVRVGRYATRDRAGEAVQQMARQNVHGVIVEAEPR